jgi:hypothetical protein
MVLSTAGPQGSLLGVDSLLAQFFEGDNDSLLSASVAGGGEVICDEDFADCYLAGKGRPSIPPSLLMRAMLCQIRDHVSDREAARTGGPLRRWRGGPARRGPRRAHRDAGPAGGGSRADVLGGCCRAHRRRARAASDRSGGAHQPGRSQLGGGRARHGCPGSWRTVSAAQPGRSRGWLVRGAACSRRRPGWAGASRGRT